MNGDAVLPPSQPGELPRVTVELEALEILVGAYLDTLTFKEKRRFLRAVFKRQEQAEAIDPGIVVPLRNRAFVEARDRKRRGALAWTRARLPAWMM